MKLKIIKSEKFIKVASWFSGSNIIGIQVFIWLLVHDLEYWGKHTMKLNHENIHFQQGKELLFIGFWLLYALNYLINLFVYNFDRRMAYKNIIFEKEAYKMEGITDYISKRKPYDFIKYGDFK
ncbi:MAG: hypothetical protein V3W20_11685 [Candidatus Neomarinimicrobiota bacterium]